MALSDAAVRFRPDARQLEIFVCTYSGTSWKSFFSEIALYLGTQSSQIASGNLNMFNCLLYLLSRVFTDLSLKKYKPNFKNNDNV